MAEPPSTDPDRDPGGSTSPAVPSPASAAERPPSRLLGLWRIPFFYGWVIVVVVFIAEFVASGVGTFVTPLFFKELHSEMGWSLTMLTGALTAQTLANAGLSPIMGSLLDRFGARPVMLFGATVAGLGLLMLSQIQEIWQFWFLYGTVGALGLHEMGGFTGPVLITKWFSRSRGRAMAIATLGTTAGGMVMAPIVGWLIASQGWRASWAIMGILVLVLMVPLIILFVRRQPEDMGLLPDGDRAEMNLDAKPLSARRRRFAGTEESWTMNEAMRTRTFWYMVIGFNLVNLSASITVIHLVPFLTLQEGISAQAAAYIVSIRLAGSSASRIIWGFAVEWFPMNACLAVGFCARAMIPLSLALLPYPANVIGAIAGSVLGGGFAVLQPMAFSNYFGRLHAGAIQGAVRPFLTVSTLAGPLLIAFLYDTTGSFDLGFVIASSVGLASPFLALLATPPRRAKML